MNASSFSLLPMPPLNANITLSLAIADEIWQYRMGGNLTVFDKDYDAAEIAKVLTAKHTASLQLLCTVGGNQARLDARTKFKILERSLKGHITSHPRQRATPPSEPP